MYHTPNQKSDRFVFYLELINTSLKNDICIVNCPRISLSKDLKDRIKIFNDTVNDNDMLSYSLTTMMCFLTKEWYGFQLILLTYS